MSIHGMETGMFIMTNMKDQQLIENGILNILAEMKFY